MTTTATPQATRLIQSGTPSWRNVVVVVAALAALTIAVTLWLLLASDHSHTGTVSPGGGQQTAQHGNVGGPANACRPAPGTQFC